MLNFLMSAGTLLRGGVGGFFASKNVTFLLLSVFIPIILYLHFKNADLQERLSVAQSERGGAIEKVLGERQNCNNEKLIDLEKGSKEALENRIERLQKVNQQNAKLIEEYKKAREQTRETIRNNSLLDQNLDEATKKLLNDLFGEENEKVNKSNKRSR